jgi:hypothetical protein
MQEMQEQPWYVLSMGAGVNSIALMHLLVRRGLPLDEAVFADTGAEVPETYDALERATAYLAALGIPTTRLAKRGADLYDVCVRRRVIPSAIWRWSTRDFKVGPIMAHYRSLRRPIVQYLAIAYDEIERVRDAPADWVTNVYPLVDEKLTRQGCIDLIEGAGFPLPVKSGCYFCPFNSLERWQWLDAAHPDLYDRAVALEEQSKHFPRQRLTDQVFRHRSKITLRELRDKPRVEVGTVDPQPCATECFT